MKILMLMNMLLVGTKVLPFGEDLGGVLNSAQTLEEKEEMRDKLLRLYIHEERIPEAEELIRNETALDIRKLRLSHALHKKDIPAVHTEMDALPTDTSQEMVRFKQLYSTLLNIGESGRRIENMTDAERLAIEDITHSATSNRVVAEGILAQANKEQLIRVPENPAQTVNAARQSNSIYTNIEVENIELFISPNPTREIVNIHYKFGNEDSSKEIILADIVTGKTIIQKTVNEQVGITYIDVHSFSSGLYMVHIKEDNVMVKSAKLVIVQ